MRIPLSLLLFVLLGLVASAPLSAQQPASTHSSAQSLAELKEKIEGDNRNHPVASVGWADEALQKLATEPDPASAIWFLTRLVGDHSALSDDAKAETTWSNLL